MFLGINLCGQEIVSKTIETVVIDAGHGGKDPGALGRYSKEKDITLAIALKTGKLIESQHPDVKVIYTRTTDNFVELYQRANIANKAKADLFLSIHANSNKNRDANGVEFYVLGLHKADDNLDVAKKENAVVNYEGNVNENYGFDPNSPEGNIMMTMKQSLYLDKSVKMAKTIENNFSSQSDQVIRGTRQAGFVVLYKTSMPSVLVETGFISNPDEENYISSPKGQKEIATKIANAFTEYKANYENATVVDVTKNDQVNDVLLAESSSAPRQSLSLASEAAKSDPGVSYFNKYQNDLNKEKAKTATQMKNAKQTVKEEVITETVVEQVPTQVTEQVSTQVIEEVPTQVIEEAPTQVADVPSIITEPIKEEVREVVVINENPIEEEPVIENTTNKTTELQSQFSSPKTETRILSDEEVKKVRIREFNNLNNPGSTTSNNNNNVSDLAYEMAANNTITETTTIIEEAPKPTKPSKPNKTSTKTTPTTPSYVNNESVRNDVEDNVKVIDRSTPKATKPAPIETASIPESGMVYKIQIKASGNKIASSDPLNKLNEKIEMSQEGGMYKYLVGNFSSRDQAVAKLNQIKAKGVKDAFIVKYQNGVRQ